MANIGNLVETAFKRAGLINDPSKEMVAFVDLACNGLIPGIPFSARQAFEQGYQLRVNFTGVDRKGDRPEFARVRAFFGDEISGLLERSFEVQLSPQGKIIVIDEGWFKSDGHF